jgi:hypothetical protein
MLGFISATTGAILLAIGILALLSARVRGFLSMIPFGNARLWAIIFIAVGLLTGGFGVIKSLPSQFSGQVASIGSIGTGAVTETELINCIYTAGSAVNSTAITIAQKTGSSVDIIVTIDNSSLLAADGSLAVATDDLVNLTWSCDRSGGIGDDASVQVLVKGATFKNELSTSDSAIYNILETSTTPSRVFSDRYTQKAYIGDNAYATSASPKDAGYVTFTESEVTQTVGVLADLDSNSFKKLALNSATNYQVLQKVNGQEKVIAVVTISKIA